MASIIDKNRENRLGWLGLVLRRVETVAINVVKNIRITWIVEGKWETKNKVVF